MSISDAAEQERALLAEIARVSGLVNREKLRKERIQSLRFDRNQPNTVVPPLPTIQKRQYSARGRGRGRGGSYGQVLPSRKYVRGVTTKTYDGVTDAYDRRRGGMAGRRGMRGRRGSRGRGRGRRTYAPGRQATAGRGNKTKVRQRKGYCMFFIKRGECKNKEHCRFTHDPSKVRVCPAFVRGKCEDDECLLQHKVDQELMPVCFHFLNGTCSKENCPYSHVRVNHNASVCKDFAKGYCAKGSSCTELHSLDCQTYLKTGYCQQKELKKCPLRHSRKLRLSLSGKKRRQRLEKKLLEDNRVKESVENDRSLFPRFALESKVVPGDLQGGDSSGSDDDSDDMASSDEEEDEEEMVWFESEEEEDYYEGEEREEDEGEEEGGEYDDVDWEEEADDFGMGDSSEFEMNV